MASQWTSVAGMREALPPPLLSTQQGSAPLRREELVSELCLAQQAEEEEDGNAYRAVYGDRNAKRFPVHAHK